MTRLAGIMVLAVLLLAALAGWSLVLSDEAEAQTPSPAGTLLGVVVLMVGNSGGDYGYATGSYGSLVSGTWPGALFGDGNPRTVSQAWEDDDGHWRWHYSGGAGFDWRTEADGLDDIEVHVTYPDQRNTRVFVLGSFVAEATGADGLRLEPPLPSRDWDDWEGEEVVIAFRRRSYEVASMTPVAEVSPPVADAGGFVEWVTATTPGGPVAVQLMLTVMVAAGMLWRGPQGHRPLLCLGAIVLVPWISDAIGWGDVFLSVAFLVVAVAAAMLWRILARQPA